MSILDNTIASLTGQLVPVEKPKTQEENAAIVANTLLTTIDGTPGKPGLAARWFTEFMALFSGFWTRWSEWQQRIAKQQAVIADIQSRADEIIGRLETSIKEIQESLASEKDVHRQQNLQAQIEDILATIDSTKTQLEKDLTGSQAALEKIQDENIPTWQQQFDALGDRAGGIVQLSSAATTLFVSIMTVAGLTPKQIAKLLPSIPVTIVPNNDGTVVVKG